MKSNKFFAAMFAATTIFFSCTNENSDIADGNDAQLTIGITNTDSKAVGEVPVAGDNKVNNFVAYVFTNDGRLEEAIESANGGEVTSTKVTTMAKKVYVVANRTKTQIGSVSRLDDLLGKLGDLANGGVCTQSSASGGSVWATGSADLSFTLNKTSNKYEGTVSVSLTFVPARITLEVKNTITEGTDYSFEMKGVAVLNANKETKFFGTSLVPSSVSYYAGLDMTGMAYIPTTYSTISFLHDTYSSSATKFHYYVFENSATTEAQFPTILTAYGDLIKKSDGSKETRYFPLHFASYDVAGESVTRGKSYNVVMTMTGSADNLPGTVDPTKPSINADLKITISAAAWTPKAIEKDF